MSVVEKFLLFLFGTIALGIVLTNPGGVSGLLNGIGGFTSRTVGAFAGSGGFAGRAK